jgi:signal transduction histidine kinase
VHTLYRAAQEGLTNAHKHAAAQHVVVSLGYHPTVVGLRVQDDGKGADLDAAHLSALESSFGLFGLRERAHLLGGALRIETAPGQGFCLEITLPTEKAA